MSISIHNLDFSYSRLPTLRNISAAAYPGKITALIGPNAAGKSTLLRCMIGALTPQSGEARLDGAPILSMSAKKIATRIAYVSQRSTVSAAFTVRQVVELGRYALPRDNSKIEEALDRLELRDIADRPYPQLSVGQQQRVTLARAVAQASRDGILILDEPTAAMDLSHVSACIRLLRELASAGAAIVVALHDLALASNIADDVWLLENGQIICQGPAPDVMTIEQLQRVFIVPFEWMQGSNARPQLMARV